ncbi:uncharacterized protein LOC143880142 [Tasmannia lanceolata]|uniref:uncharacterized protein LOC143880142 n=1 Tax=Tasmannia lanceolata TaxID=3420 RepID=UPI004063E247
MADRNRIGLPEGHSTTRPPFFNGSNYGHWKTRMRIYLLSIDVELWHIVENGCMLPSKPFEEWNVVEKRHANLNYKAINSLFCALSTEEFNRVALFDSAKVIWDTLAVTHEGTSQVKDSKINLLNSKYEMFRMDQNESISEMYTRFSKISNELANLGKSYPTDELVSKLLRSLPPYWDPKVTAIQESKNLKTLTMEELVGSLITHEMLLTSRQDEKKPKEKEKESRSLALKASKANSSSSSEADSDEEETLRKFKSLWRKKHKKDKMKKKEESEVEGGIRCYNCKKTGYKRPDCPLLKSSSSKYKGKKE